MTNNGKGVVWRPRPEKTTRHGLLRLDKNERVTEFGENLLDKLKDKITWEDICSYPETSGIYEILSSIHKMKEENFILTAGSDGAIKLCFEAFSEKGKKVMFMSPTFAMVEVYCKCYGAIPYRIEYDSDLQINWDGIQNKGYNDVNFIILANPNSPTGTEIPIERLESIVAQACISNIPVLVDEAYFGFTKTTAIGLIEKYKNLVVSRTFSKAFGLAGLRVGYLVSSNQLAAKLFSFRPMYEVNQIAVIFAKYLLDNPSIVDQYIEECKLGENYIFAELKRLGVRYKSTKANFFHIDLGDFKNKILEDCKNKKILIKESGIPQMRECLRITIGPKYQMKKILEIIESYYHS